MSPAPRRLVIALAGSAWLAAGMASAQETIPLNSERIEMRFGSYGIDVLEQDERRRVSNLYSERDGEKVTRTFAIVSYPSSVPRALAEVHAAITAGGSIGAVLAADGWRVRKHNRFIGTMPATPKLRAMMQLADASELAMHAYVLEVEGGDRRLDYAMIIEIHHPDYLSAFEVAAIYGPVPRLSRAERRTLEAALAQARQAAQ